MTREEKQKAIDALKISAPVMAVTQEEFSDYIQTINQVMDWLEQEPTTKNCRSCRNFGSHHGICEICKDNKCWTEQEPTKNDLGVDCISRKAAEDITWQDPSYTDPLNILTEVRDKIRELPSVTPQETRWIPVGERLPEKNMECLVAVGRFNFTEIATYSDLMGIIDHKIFYQGDVGHDNFKNITQYVKAWMLLPKQYEPQESEEEE